MYKNLFEQGFAKASKSNTLDSYGLFIKEYPNAPQVNQALANIYALTKKENNIAGYEWFIKEYPDAPQVKEAIENMHRLAFDEAKEIDTISAYNTFVITYPLAREVKKANEIAYEMDKAKYSDVLPEWVRNVFGNFIANILNGIFGIFASEEKQSRQLLIKAKQIERQADEYSGATKAGYLIVANRMYELLQAEYDDTDATLRYLESREFKDFVHVFKDIMKDVSRILNRIESNTERMGNYAKEMVSVAQKGFDDAKADRDMAAFYTKQHRDWEQRMHLKDKGYL